MNKLYPDESLSFDTSSQDCDGIRQSKHFLTMCELYEGQGPGWWAEATLDAKRNKKNLAGQANKLLLTCELEINLLSFGWGLTRGYLQICGLDNFLSN